MLAIEPIFFLFGGRMVPHALKVERVRLGVPQYRLAAALGITQSAVCAWENGRRPMTPQQERDVRVALQRLVREAQTSQREAVGAIA